MPALKKRKRKFTRTVQASTAADLLPEWDDTQSSRVVSGTSTTSTVFSPSDDSESFLASSTPSASSRTTPTSSIKRGRPRGVVKPYDACSSRQKKRRQHALRALQSDLGVPCDLDFKSYYSREVKHVRDPLGFLEDEHEVQVSRLLQMEDGRGLSVKKEKEVLQIVGLAHNQVDKLRERVTRGLEEVIPFNGTRGSKIRHFAVGPLLKSLLELYGLGPGRYHILVQGDGHSVGHWRKTVSVTLKIIHVSTPGFNCHARESGVPAVYIDDDETYQVLEENLGDFLQELAFYQEHGVRMNGSTSECPYHSPTMPAPDAAPDFEGSKKSTHAQFDMYFSSDAKFWHTITGLTDPAHCGCPVCFCLDGERRDPGKKENRARFNVRAHNKYFSSFPIPFLNYSSVTDSKNAQRSSGKWTSQEEPDCIHPPHQASVGYQPALQAPHF